MSSLSLHRWFLRFLTLVLAGYVMALGLIRAFESRLVFFPNYPDRLSGDWNAKFLPKQDTWIKSADGIKLHAWWIPKENASHTFLAFHGNAGSTADRAEIYKFFGDVPANVFAVEYRGYGKSDGVPSESGLYLDAEAGFDYLVTTKRIPQKKIISFGQSLGTAIAAHLAARREVGGVVLEAPFPLASAVVRQKLWFFPGLSLLVISQFDTESELQQIKAPIMIVHCKEDPVIPSKLGKEVYDKAREPKALVVIDGYCHEEASIVAPALYRARLQVFLSQIESAAGRQ